jgi:hypothetical protein
MPYKEKSQYDEFQMITTMAQNHHIPKLIIDGAIRYHKKISEQKTFRGLNRHGIIAASIYISCSMNNYPRTAKEIATIFNLDCTSATKGCKNAISIINTLETDFVNKQITNELINRQQDIMTRLLEAENAERERDEKEERESITAEQYENIVPPSLEEYIKKQKGSVELYKNIPPRLKPYYRVILEKYVQNVFKINF